MRRLAVVALCLLLAGCGEGGSKAAEDSCKPSGTGSTDVKNKPKVEVPKAPAPPPPQTSLTDIVCGTGEEVKDGSKVEVHYVGVVYNDGREFASSWAGGAPQPLTVDSKLLPGLRKGLLGMRVGGRRQVVVPSKDGFGEQSNGDVAAGSTLLFIFDVVKIQKPAERTACTPSGSGTTDLKKKPVVTVPTTPDPDETRFVDIVCGSGAQADVGSAVTVKYVGVLYFDGKEFDSSWSRGPDETLPFTVGAGVVPGFSKGVTGMKVGGRRMIIIPSKDGYGDEGRPPSIPGGATLVFVIDLVTVT